MAILDTVHWRMRWCTSDDDKVSIVSIALSALPR
jgi:hypothetical protein